MGGAPSQLTRDEQRLAVRRIRDWPKPEREHVIKLAGAELEATLAVAALLHGWPCPDPPARGPGVIELP